MFGSYRFSIKVSEGNRYLVFYHPVHKTTLGINVLGPDRLDKEVGLRRSHVFDVGVGRGHSRVETTVQGPQPPRDGGFRLLKVRPLWIHTLLRRIVDCGRRVTGKTSRNFRRGRRCRSGNPNFH